MEGTRLWRQRGGGNHHADSVQAHGAEGRKGGRPANERNKIPGELVSRGDGVLETNAAGLCQIVPPVRLAGSVAMCGAERTWHWLNSGMPNSKGRCGLSPLSGEVAHHVVTQGRNLSPR